MNEDKYCIGCGVKLQDSNMLFEGYTADLSNNLCSRCFKLKNYGEYQLTTKSNSEYIDILKSINETKDLVLYIVDLFNIEKDIKMIREYISNRLILVVTKRDVLPKSVNDEKIKEYFMLLKGLGHNVKLNGKFSEIKPYQMQRILDDLKDSSDYEMLTELGLRSMQKAIYSTTNEGHFGLASKCYCHFTSPIRRYPDDTVHKVLKLILHGSDLTGKELQDLSKELEREAEHSSLKERNAIECERDVEDMKMAEYMQDHIGEEFDAKVAGVVPSGMFVRLENMVEGRVHVGSMKGDYYIVDEVSQMIIGKKSGKKYRLGDTVRVKCTDASKVEGTIDFELIGGNNEKTEEK